MIKKNNFHCLCVLNFIFVTSSVSAQQPALGSLHIHGVDYENSCQHNQLLILQSSLLNLTKERNPNNAWFLIKTLLCGRRGEKAYETTLRHSPKLISYVEMNVGSTPEPRKMIEPDMNLLADTMAWDAQVSVAGQYLKDIDITYSTNSACNRSIRLRFNGRAWLIIELSDACD